MVRNSHPRDEHSRWGRNDVGSKATCQSDRKSQGRRFLAEQRGQQSRRMDRKRPWRLAMEFARGRRKVKGEERQRRKRQRRLVERKDPAELVQTREREGGEEGDKVKEGADQIGERRPVIDSSDYLREFPEDPETGQEPKAAVEIAEGVAVVRPSATLRGDVPIAEELLEKCHSLAELGVGLWYYFLRSSDGGDAVFSLGSDHSNGGWWQKLRQGLRACKEKRALFPLPSGWEGFLQKFPVANSLHELLEDRDCVKRFSVACWSELSVCFCNRLHGCEGILGSGPPTKVQASFLESIEMNIKQILRDDSFLAWKEKDIVEDFDKRLISYTGEEVPKAEPLSVYRTAAALPPEGHGGCINIEEFVTGRTKWLLQNPRSCVVEDDGQRLPKLQSKVHVKAGEELALAKLLVARGICSWVPEEKVLCYRGEKVLNGMFGIAKSKVLATGQTALRCIMNLVPSNSVLRPIRGRIDQLPHICQWLHVSLEEDEEVRLCQSDMVSAFYLFALPPGWAELLCFDLQTTGRNLQLPEAQASQVFYLGCRVLPMGWSSAVGVMQFIAEEVLFRGDIPKEAQLRRSTPLPSWVVKSWEEGQSKGRLWWHVYLDNYASGEKLKANQEPVGGEIQAEVEKRWQLAGILSSADKAVRNSSSATELGAHVGGGGLWIGASAERLQKLLKTTLWFLAQKSMPRRRLQMVMGRWVFAMQFRRPYMSNFHKVWEATSTRRTSPKVMRALRLELVYACFGIGLLHTSMTAKVGEDSTCSDASLWGGAIAISRHLSSEGKAFLSSQTPEVRPKRIPVVVISLFNGVGGAPRCYDLAGVEVAGMLFCDVHGPANRVSSRRWPGAVMWQDIRSLTKDALEEKIMGMEDFEEIHVWAGFPCVDLSSARANRKNLEGESSSLVFEATRVVEDLKALYPGIPVRKVFENVASMDAEAREAISELLGAKPYRLDPSWQVPMSRPRLCWTDLEIFETSEVTLIEQEGYTELQVPGEWPEPSAWLEPGCWQFDPSVIYPTCMKSVPKEFPPNKPAQDR